MNPRKKALYVKKIVTSNKLRKLPYGRPFEKSMPKTVSFVGHRPPHAGPGTKAYCVVDYIHFLLRERPSVSVVALLGDSQILKLGMGSQLEMIWPFISQLTILDPRGLLCTLNLVHDESSFQATQAAPTSQQPEVTKREEGNEAVSTAVKLEHGESSFQETQAAPTSHQPEVTNREEGNEAVSTTPSPADDGSVERVGPFQHVGVYDNGTMQGHTWNPGTSGFSPDVPNHLLGPHENTTDVSRNFTENSISVSEPDINTNQFEAEEWLKGVFVEISTKP